MDPIKEAFTKVKQDIDSLYQDREMLRQEISEIKHYLSQISKKLDYFLAKTRQTNSPQNKGVSTHNSTHNYSFKPLNTQILPISKGNQGVSTDRQTDRQTDVSTHIKEKNPKTETSDPSENTIDNAVEILESLDNLKKEIRLKFKRLTEQELLVFSTIYQLEEENGYADHKMLSEKLGLSESSIRDYVSRLIKKGIPVEKTKVNNKAIRLSIAPNLKKIATLSTILQLRDL